MTNGFHILSSWSSRLTVFVAITAIAMAWFRMEDISRVDPWYRNTDMNIQNITDALAINAGIPPDLIDQPGVTSKFLLALDYRIRHHFGFLDVWNMDTLGHYESPLKELPTLISVGRVHSRTLVLMLIILAGWFAYSVTRETSAMALTITILCGSTGLLFHGLLTRPELLCVCLGVILAFACTFRAINSSRWQRKYGWLFLAGIFVGLSTLSKLPGLVYLFACYAWCWLAPLIDTQRKIGTHSDQRPDIGFWRGILPVAGGISMLWLLFHLETYHDTIGPVSTLRLHIAATGASLLPLVSLWKTSHPLWRYLRERCSELALLGSGALSSLPIIYLLLRGVLGESGAADYIARILHYVFNPSPSLAILIDSPRVDLVFLQYFHEDTFLFISVIVLALCIFPIRAIPLRVKALVSFLFLTGMGMIIIMSKRHFTPHYAVFFHVPFILAGALSLYAWAEWFRQKYSTWHLSQYAMPLLTIIAFIVTLTVSPRLQHIYNIYQNDATLPVNEFTLTFLYDHDSHTSEYLKIMEDHYKDRNDFRLMLERYISETKNLQ